MNRVASQKHQKPRLLITMGDVAGVGPEIIAKAWPELTEIGDCAVVGDPDWLRRALDVTGARMEIVSIDHPARAAPSSQRIPCIRATDQHLSEVQIGQVHPV